MSPPSPQSSTRCTHRPDRPSSRPLAISARATLAATRTLNARAMSRAGSAPRASFSSGSSEFRRSPPRSTTRDAPRPRCPAPRAQAGGLPRRSLAGCRKFVARYLELPRCSHGSRSTRLGNRRRYGRQRVQHESATRRRSTRVYQGTSERVARKLDPRRMLSQAGRWVRRRRSPQVPQAMSSPPESSLRLGRYTCPLLDRAARRPSQLDTRRPQRPSEPSMSAPSPPLIRTETRPRLHLVSEDPSSRDTAARAVRPAASARSTPVSEDTAGNKVARLARALEVAEAHGDTHP